MAKKKEYKAEKMSELRKQAEELLQAKQIEPENLPGDVKALIHELQVHQIELEMQNDELRKAQHEIEAARDRYVNLYDFAPVGYLTISDKGIVQEANLTISLMLGVERSRLIKQPFSRFVFPEDQDSYYLHFRLFIETGEPQQCELRLLKKDGLHFWADLAGATVTDAAGNVAQCRITVNDITERKQAEKRKWELARERDRIQILTSFITQASHEFRTPLSIINMSVFFLGKLSQAEEQQKRLRSIEQQVGDITTLLEALTTMARLDSIQKLEREKIHLDELLKSVYVSKQDVFQARNIRVVLEFGGHPVTILGDWDYLQMAVKNLLDNAIQFTPDEGTITVRLNVLPQQVHIKVIDTGSGISADETARIFERFYRVDKAGTTRGFGLGLPIAKTIIELHQGSIEVESEPGRGSSFTIMLPLA